MWKPARVVSANFLERIGESASPFHSDYQAYQKGDISKTELIARLPHVAMVGDSACMGVHISSIWGTFWRVHNRAQSHRIAVLMYVLFNFDSYFRGREIAERLRVNDAARYPHLESTYKYFTSFRPAYRSNLIRLARMVNEELREIVRTGSRAQDYTMVRLRYSDALATADLSRAELLHPIDGWHASVEGHNVLAEAAFRDLVPSLEFLGFM